MLERQAIFACEAHIQDEAGRAVWAWALLELVGGRAGDGLHPQGVDEAG